MEPVQPMAPPDLDATDVVVSVYIDGPSPDRPAYIVFDAGTVVERNLVAGPGPWYPALADGTLLRIQWDPTLRVGPHGDDDDVPGGWAVRIINVGVRTTGADILLAGDDAGWPNRTQVYVARGQRPGPFHVEPSSPAARHRWRHRAHTLRTCRAARWWSAIADEYDQVLPDGWDLVDEGSEGWWLIGPDSTDEPLALTPEGVFIVVEDGGGPVTVATQRQIIASWAQITGPDFLPAATT